MISSVVKVVIVVTVRNVMFHETQTIFASSGANDINPLMSNGMD